MAAVHRAAAVLKRQPRGREHKERQWMAAMHHSSSSYAQETAQGRSRKSGDTPLAV